MSPDTYIAGLRRAEAIAETLIAETDTSTRDPQALMQAVAAQDAATEIIRRINEEIRSINR